ncbi:unnamed protein product [Didymodactylos carnosus]|uniref:Uncharacterized protein n=1 Tax=Didymodactylos carnosus TaxID=1234261 RepID=A0A815PN93_9BILA|nr:unnamed protein product [Didymodactylos carnosus]CAF1451184.1 unnamed protein product [Didymodactylos carnosus]CAF3629361.1 unnamed protein product [Didymodactylos carnosus]CAF4324464.1 unnamed protein product [Didymodactylos carnosus]
MSTYKLYYFNLRARGEVIRLIFIAADQKFEDVRYDYSEWENHKNEMSLGQMPVLEVDGQKIPQSLSIARFIAKQLNLAGNDNLEQAKVDSVVDTIADLMQQYLTKIFMVKEESQKDEAKQKFLKEDATKQLTNLENLLTNYGQNGPFFLGNQLTWADLMFFEKVTTLSQLDKNLLEKYPKLKRCHEEVGHNPKIAAYLKSRPNATHRSNIKTNEHDSTFNV